MRLSSAVRSFQGPGVYGSECARTSRRQKKKRKPTKCGASKGRHVLPFRHTHPGRNGALRCARGNKVRGAAGQAWIDRCGAGDSGRVEGPALDSPPAFALHGRPEALSGHWGGCRAGDALDERGWGGARGWGGSVCARGRRRIWQREPAGAHGGRGGERGGWEDGRGLPMEVSAAVIRRGVGCASARLWTRRGRALRASLAVQAGPRSVRSGSRGTARDSAATSQVDARDDGFCRQERWHRVRGCGAAGVHNRAEVA